MDLKQIKQETVYSFGDNFQAAKMFLETQREAKLSSPSHEIYEVVITTILFDATEH